MSNTQTKVKDARVVQRPRKTSRKKVVKWKITNKSHASSNAEETAHALGYSMGLQIVDPLEWATKLEAGFPYSRFRELQHNIGLPASQIADAIQITPRTLTRRKGKGRLTPPESDRLLRLARIYEATVELFEGDSGAAVQWLCAAKRALGGHTPLELVRTDIGTREVEQLIGRLEHGVFS